MDRQATEQKIADDRRQAEIERNKLKQRHGQDRELERETQTVRPHSDPPSRAGITPDGSGADGERG